MDIEIKHHVVKISGDGIPSQTSNSVEAVLLYEILQILKHLLTTLSGERE